MQNARNILETLQAQAEEAAKSLNVEQRVEDAREAAGKVRRRLEEDPQARTAAIGGGVLLTALLATSGGRKLIGNIAKTGAVAGLGVLAYRAGQKRQGAGTADENAAAEAAGYITGDNATPAFDRAIIIAMTMAAYADGTIDPGERAALSKAARDEAGKDFIIRILTGEISEDEAMDQIAAAAFSPNHAAQLYAAASVATGNPTEAESAFLTRLAARLGIEASHAEALRKEAGVTS